MTNNIKVYDNLIPDFFVDKVIDNTEQVGWLHGWKSNREYDYLHWNIKWFNSAVKSRKDFSSELQDDIRGLWNLLRGTIAQDYPHLLRCYSNAYTFGTEGYPHTDSKLPNDMTILIYLNKEWDYSWGGSTLFFDDNREIIKAVMPKFGRVVMFPGNVCHQAAPITKWCNECRMIIVFKCCPLEDGNVNVKDLYKKYGIEGKVEDNDQTDDKAES